MVAALVAAATLTGCSGSGGDSGQLAQVDFVVGNVVYPVEARQALKDKFPYLNTTYLYPGVNGIFRYNNDIYSYNNGEIEPLLEGIWDCGYLNYDRIPVVMRGEAPVIRDSQLNPVFTADEVDGAAVTSVGDVYSNGLLRFLLSDGRTGFFDVDGKVAFMFDDPKSAANVKMSKCDYNFKHGFIVAYINNRYVTVNTKGKELWEIPEDRFSRQGEYIVIFSDSDDRHMMTDTYYSATGKKEKTIERPVVFSIDADNVDEEYYRNFFVDYEPFNIKPMVNQTDDKQQRWELLCLMQSAKSKFLGYRLIKSQLSSLR